MRLIAGGISFGLAVWLAARVGIDVGDVVSVVGEGLDRGRAEVESGLQLVGEAFSTEF